MFANATVASASSISFSSSSSRAVAPELTDEDLALTKKRYHTQQAYEKLTKILQLLANKNKQNDEIHYSLLSTSISSYMAFLAEAAPENNNMDDLSLFLIEKKDIYLSGEIVASILALTDFLSEKKLIHELSDLNKLYQHLRQWEQKIFHEYEVEKNNLKVKISALDNPKITVPANKVLNQTMITQLQYPEKTRQLTQVLNATTEILAPAPPTEDLVKYEKLAKKTAGAGSWGKKIAGAMLVLSGVVGLTCCFLLPPLGITILTGVIAATSAFSTSFILGGILSWWAGKRKGAADAMHEMGNIKKQYAPTSLAPAAAIFPAAEHKQPATLTHIKQKSRAKRGGVEHKSPLTQIIARHL